MEPDAAIERALTRIRREQQSRRLQRSGAAGTAPGDGARYRYLDALDEAPKGRPISVVAEAIGVDRPRASRLTNELLGEELIERVAHDTDARVTLVRLTPEGRALVSAMHENRRAAVTRALSGFTDQETKTLAQLLDRFLDAWDAPQ